MRSKQAGITLIGWVVLLAPMAVCIYAGIRLVLPIAPGWMLHSIGLISLV